MRQAPESLQRTQVLGSIDVVEGNFGAAADAFASVFDVQPNFETARLYYLAAANAGRPNPVEKLSSWLQSNPLDARANAMFASIALENQDYVEAIERFELVLNAEPESSPILNNLAWLYNELGDDRALDYAERAYAIAPQSQLPPIADTLGWILLQRGESARALELLEQAAAGAPDAAEIQYHYAAALIENGRTELGVQVLNSALAMPGEFPWRADAEELLSASRSVQ
jgi:tetratricopeptide (TPR) repeat protein